MIQTKLRRIRTNYPLYYNLVLNGIGTGIAMAVVWLFTNSPEVYRYLSTRYSTNTLIGLLIVLVALCVSVFFLLRTKHFAQLKYDPRTMPPPGDMEILDGGDGADGGGANISR